jgi:hypothetical protein
VAMAAAAAAPLEQLPPITHDNAAAYPPPDLRPFRSAASRTADSAPALWFKQMTGAEWDGGGHSYELEKKRHRRMLEEHTKSERERELKRDRSGRAKQEGRVTSYTTEQQRVYKAQRREEQRPERERAREAAAAAAAADRAVEEQRRREERAAFDFHRERLQAHFVRLLTTGGVQNAECFVYAAEQVGLLCSRKVNGRRLTMFEVTETLLLWCMDYDDFIRQHPPVPRAHAEFWRSVILGKPLLMPRSKLESLAPEMCHDSEDDEDMTLVHITKVRKLRTGDGPYRLRYVREFGTRLSVREVRAVLDACADWLDVHMAASRGFPIEGCVMGRW